MKALGEKRWLSRKKRKTEGSTSSSTACLLCSTLNAERCRISLLWHRFPFFSPLMQPFIITRWRFCDAPFYLWIGCGGLDASNAYSAICMCVAVFFISAEIDSFHVANKFDANASSNTAHTYQQHRNMPRFSILRHQYCFLVVLNVRDYNVYESLCIRSHLHVCNHASSEYRCHFSIVCRFVSVYWTICFARNCSFFRIHMYPRLNSLGDVQKLDTFLSQLQNAFADSETMLCLASLPLFFSLFMLHATLILGLVFRLSATLLYVQIEIDFFCISSRLFNGWLYANGFDCVSLWHSIYVHPLPIRTIIYFVLQWASNLDKCSNSVSATIQHGIFHVHWFYPHLRSAWSLDAFHIQYHHDWKTSFAQYRSCFPNYYWNNDDQWLVFIVDHFWSNRDEIHFSHNRLVFTMVPHHFDNRPTITINDKIKNRANG